jgi:murein DD-endopeptidase MepM/ murein hydrolase activator NlpD
MTFIPKLDTATIANPANSARAAQPNEVALRHAASQFESLLLTQLTAALNPKDEDEDTLFSNSGGGMGLARQMYSEQLAKTMSESGGIGIANMIMSQVTKRHSHQKNHVGPVTERALAAAREIKNEAASSSAAKTNPGLSKARDLYPDAIIISEASPGAGPSPPTAGSPSLASSLSKPNDSRGAIGATRSRRIHASAGNAKILNEAPAISTTGLNTASAIKNSRPAGAYIAFHSPLRGQIRSQFGMRRDPINGRMRLHQGIDIAAKRGTPIAAAAAGTVVFAGRNKGYGNMVMIEHADGRRTLYAHAQSLLVKAGDTVAAGQNIAAVGSTGHSTGPHLHFEVRESNRPVNPLTALSNDIAFARR